MSELTRTVAGLALVLAAACIDPATTDCFGNLCPRGTVCVAELERCIDQERVQVCAGAGLVDGDRCQLAGQPGVCAGGVCGTGCGDGLMLADEVCDGRDFGALSCLDFDFYQGTLGCSASCDAVETTQCQGFCGDGQVNGPELCDPAYDARVDCNQMGYDRGVATCGASCRWPTQGCGLNQLAVVPGLIPPGDPIDVHAFAPGHLLMTSGNGTLLRATGDHFEAIPTPAQGFMTGLWAANEDVVYSVSRDGEVVHLENGAWVLDQGVPASGLLAVTGLSDGRVWAAGFQQVVHYDGTAWQRVPTPDPDMNPDTPWTLNLEEIGVSQAASGAQLWVGGDDWFPDPSIPPLHRYENGVWTSYPELGGLSVSDIYVATPTDVYVTLDEFLSSFISTPNGRLIHFHYDGAAWIQTDLSASGLPAYEWLSVAGTGPNNIYALGFEFSWDRLFAGLDPFHYELWRFDGVTWQAFEANAPNTTKLSVTGGAVVGLEYDSGAGMPGIRRFDGTAWFERARGAALGQFCAATVPDAPPACGPFTPNPTCHDLCDPTTAGHATGAALAGPGQLVITSSAVDTVDPIVAIPFLWSYDAATGYAEIPFPGGDPVPLHDAFTPDGGDTVFAVGDQGVALVRSGGVWTRHATPGGKALRAVHGRAANDVYAVGEGVVLHFDGTMWTAVHDAGAVTLEAVWIGAGGTAFAGGSGCTLLSNALGSWQPVVPAPACSDASSVLAGVYAPQPTDVLVSEHGPSLTVVHRFDGSAWTTAAEPIAHAGQPQYTRWFELGDGFTLVGNPFGALADGTWSALRPPTPGFLPASAGITGTDRSIYFVQTDGAILELQRLWPWVCEATETRCADRMDDDCDGQFDADDTDCQGP